jgi:hypothetical protein
LHKYQLHQLTRGHKVLRGIQHAIATSNSFEIPPVFLRSFSLLCHTVCSLKLSDPKDPDLRAVQGRGAQDYRRYSNDEDAETCQSRPLGLVYHPQLMVLYEFTEIYSALFSFASSGIPSWASVALADGDIITSPFME